jgi:hypothetical protein
MWSKRNMRASHSICYKKREKGTISSLLMLVLRQTREITSKRNSADDSLFTQYYSAHMLFVLRVLDVKKWGLWFFSASYQIVIMRDHHILTSLASQFIHNHRIIHHPQQQKFSFFSLSYKRSHKQRNFCQRIIHHAPRTRTKDTPLLALRLLDA